MYQDSPEEEHRKEERAKRLFTEVLELRPIQGQEIWITTASSSAMSVEFYYQFPFTKCLKCDIIKLTDKIK